MSTLTPVQKKLLLERAKRLAMPPAQVSEDIQLELLTFQVGLDWAALELSRLAGVLLPEITALPDISARVLGIQSVRGQVVSVLDAAKLLELPEAPTGLNPNEARVLLLETPHGLVGLKVDRVGETRKVPRSSLTPPSSGKGGVLGVLEGRILVLEVGGLLERVGN